jgi:hypothetical protein
MGDLTAMVLMVVVTLIALAVIWGTYFFRRCPLEREQSDVKGSAERIMGRVPSPFSTASKLETLRLLADFLAVRHGRGWL